MRELLAEGLRISRKAVIIIITIIIILLLLLYYYYYTFMIILILLYYYCTGLKPTAGCRSCWGGQHRRHFVLCRRSD